MPRCRENLVNDTQEKEKPDISRSKEQNDESRAVRDEILRTFLRSLHSLRKERRESGVFHRKMFKTERKRFW